MPLLQPKQVEKYLNGFVRVNAFAGTGASNNVTAAITTALSTASSSGGSVPVQVSGATQQGVVVGTNLNRVAVFAAATKLPIADSDAREVYGRITEAAGVYTLTYYVLVAGVETAHTLAATSIDFEFSYQFNFADLPANFATGVTARNVVEDAGGGALFEVQTVTPTALNTLPTLSFAPNPANSLVLEVNGQSCRSSAGFFSLAGTTITWTPATAGFNVTTTDSIIASYRR
jgi:hypothetical protein